MDLPIWEKELIDERLRKIKQNPKSLIKGDLLFEILKAEINLPLKADSKTK